MFLREAGCIVEGLEMTPRGEDIAAADPVDASVAPLVIPCVLAGIDVRENVDVADVFVLPRSVATP